MNKFDAAVLAVNTSLAAVGIKPVEQQVVGSSYIRGVVGDNSDVDILVLVPNYRDVNDVFLKTEGWCYGGSSPTSNDRWGSWTKCVYSEEGHVEVNLLMTADPVYYEAWAKAAEVCRFITLQGIILKNGMVHGIHEIIMDDSTAETESDGRRNY